MAETGLVIPDLEEIVLRKLRGNTQTSPLDNPDYMRSQELYEELLYNEQLNKDKPIPTPEPNIFQRGINAASNAASNAATSALDLGERIAGPIVELQRRTGQRERAALQTAADVVLPSVTGVGSTALGGLLGISEYLNRLGADVAKRGPLPEGSGIPNITIEPAKVLPSGEYVPATDFRNVQNIQKEYTYQPRTNFGQVVNDVFQFPFHMITQGADLVEDTATSIGIPQQQARALAAAVEVAAFYFGDKAFRSGARSVGAKVKEFKTNLDANRLDVALKNSQELFDKVDNSIISDRLNAARIREQTAQNDLLNVLRQRGANLEADQLAADIAVTSARRTNIPPGPTLTGAQRGTTNVPTGDLTGTLPSRVPASTIPTELPVESAVPTPPIGGTTTAPTSPLANVLRSATRDVRIGGEIITSPDPVAGDILRSPDFSALEAAVIPYQPTRILGAGVDSVVMDVGNGQVLRVGIGENAPWAGIPDVIRPIDSGQVGAIRWQLMPQVDTTNITAGNIAQMHIRLRDRGFEFVDPGADNLGRLPNGNIVIIDPGAVKPIGEPAPVRNIPPTEPPGTLPVETPTAPVEPPSRPAAPSEVTQLRYANNSRVMGALDDLANEEASITIHNKALADIKAEALQLSPGKLEEGLRQLGLEEVDISDLLPRLKNVRATRVASPRAKTVGEAISESPSTVQNLTPTEVAIDIPPSDPSPVKTSTRRQIRKIIPVEPEVLNTPDRIGTNYELYQERVTARSGVAQPDLLMGEVLRRDNITFSEAEFNRMAQEVSQFRTAAEAQAYAESYIQRRGAEAPEAVTAPIVRDAVPITSLKTLPDETARGTSIGRNTQVQLMREGGKPTAIVINDGVLHTSKSLTELQAEAARMESSNIPLEGRQRNQLEQARIQAKAELFGVSTEEASTINVTEARNRIIKIANEQNLDVFIVTRQGHLEQIPKTIIETSAKLNDGDLSNPKKITAEDRAQYMAEQARETSPLTIEQIIQHLTDGDDIRATLPPQLAELYGRAMEYTQRKLTTPDRRSMKQILQSINNLLGERGAIGDIELSPLQKSAYNELRNDAIRMGKDIMDLIRGDPRLSTIEKRLLEEYSRSTKAPPPKPYMELNNMSFDSEAALRGDFVIKRAAGDAPGTYRPEIYFSDWMNVAAGDDIKARSERSIFAKIVRPESFQTATRKLLAAGQEDIVHAYRGVEQNLTKDKTDYMHAIKRMRNQFSEEQQRAIGADMFLDEGSIDLLIASNVEPRAINAAETTGKQFIRSVFEELFPRAQEVRKNTGREPMTYVENYITHMRASNIDNAFAVNTSLAEDAVNVINTRYANLKNTPFPMEKTRRGGKFPAEINAFDILEQYVDYALRQVHMGPFVAKVHELIDTPIIDPTTNKTWDMQTEKPILYKYMTKWNNYIAGKPQYTIPEPWNQILFAASRSIGNAYIAGNPGSAIIQPTSLFNTYMHVGMGHLTKATVNYLKDAATPGHPLRKFRLENSKLLDTRNADIFFDEAGQGLLEYAMQRIPGLRTAGKALEKVSGAVGNIGTKPLRFLDQVAAEVTWDAGYEFAKKAGKADEAAFNVADDIVTLTQGSSLRGERSPIQRSQAGRALTQFQTFAINNYDFLTHDILGIDNVKMTNPDRVRAIMRLIGAGTLFNILIEDVGGGNSPVPNPPLSFARSLLKGKADNESDLHYLTNLTTGGITGETLKVTPVLGSARYPRSQFGGPIVSYANELIRAGIAPETTRGERETNLPRTIVRGMLPAGATLDKALLAPERKNTGSFKTLSGADNKLRKTN